MAQDTAEIRKRIEETRSRIGENLDRIRPVASKRARRTRRQLIGVGAIAGTGLAIVLVLPILRHQRRHTRATTRARHRSR